MYAVHYSEFDRPES